MTKKTNDNKGFISRLLRDSRANTLAIGAAAIFPIVGVIGGGLDMSRAYLVKTRLQQACDAGTLAARKKLEGGKIVAGKIPNDIKQTADNFFNVNFEEGTYGTQAHAFTLSAGNETRMDGTATVDVPTTLMALFGFEKLPIAVTCSAELNLPNIDVVLVLDVSGSMGGAPIQELRAAVLSFYDEIMAVKPAGARVRFGVVPYNSNVNVGASLLAENPDYLSNSSDYQSRQSNFQLVSNNDAVTLGQVMDEGYYEGPVPRNPNDFVPGTTNVYRWRSDVGNPNAECELYHNVATHPNGVTYTVGDYTYFVKDDSWKSSYYSGGPSNNRGACISKVTYKRVAGPNDVKPETFKKVFQNYTYLARPFDTSVYKTFASATAPGAGVKGADVTSTWNGCIEERQTVATSNFDPIPAGALDLDIDLIPSPSRPETQWKPMWSAATFERNQKAPQTTTTNRSSKPGTCPEAALRLAEFEKSGSARNTVFENYINGLNAGGGTMHDIGLLWGARFLSENGIFAADNTSASNGDPIVRHLIFMTDGEMGANPAWIIAYGNPTMDERLAGPRPGGGVWQEDELAPFHNARLDALCKRIKNQNTTIWTVSFRLALSDRIKACASGDQNAFEADDAPKLDAAFKKIATSIAELRLVK